MKSLKKTLVLLVVFSMILSTIAPAFAATDVAGLDCEDQVTRMEALGVIEGFEDGTFKPEETITRAQMAVIICKMLGINEASANANAGMASKFSDVAANEWYTGWINIASNNGVIAGFPDGTFRPNETLTLNQVLTLCVKALGRGGYVDKMGTWPANYVTEAARLNLLKDVKGASDANRGTVAIICWNTLNAATWYVSSETLDGEVNLNGSDQKTLLAINFSEFTTAAGDLKEVEEVTVLRTPAMDKEIGSRQIVINDAKVAGLYTTTAKYHDEFETAPKKNEDVKTYRDGSEIVAYIPEEVYENIEDLYGKELTLVFGEDNEVALVIITDDAVIDNQLITNVNLADNTITIDGEAYKYLDGVKIYVNNIPFGTGETQLSAVLTAIGVEDVNSTRSLTKAVKANAILNSKDKVERLDLTISGNYYIDAAATTPAFVTKSTTETYMIEQHVIEEIKSKGNVIALGNPSAIYNYKDLLDNETEPRVIKDGAEISLDEIAEGDVITVASKKVDSSWEMQTIYVSSEKVTGEIDKIARSLVISVDGTKYYATKGATVSATGELEDATTPITYDELKNIDGEQAEVYLNVLGEYVAVVTESSAADAQFAVIDTVFKLNYDQDNDDEEFRKIKVLLPDGSSPRYTVKYDKKTDTTNSSVSAEKVTLENLDDTFENRLIKVKVNADNVVMIDDITFVNTAVTGKIDGDKVKAIASLSTSATVDYEDKIITESSVEYDFSHAVFMSYNTTEDKLSVVSKGWNSLVGKGNATIGDTKLVPANTIYLVEDETASILDVKLVYVETSSFTSSDVQFAVVKDVTNNRDESAKETITLTTKGGDVTYEVATSIVETSATRIEVGDFVQFKVSDDEVTVMDRVINAVELNVLDKETAIASTLVDMTLEIASGVKTVETAIISTTTKEDLVFEYDEDRADRIYYADDVVARVKLADDDIVVFDLSNMDEFGEGVTVLEDADLAELDGAVIIAINADKDETGAEILVVISNK